MNSWDLKPIWLIISEYCHYKEDPEGFGYLQGLFVMKMESLRDGILKDSSPALHRTQCGASVASPTVRNTL